MRSADWIFWVLTALAQSFVVYLFVARRLFRRFLFLSLYFLLGVLIDIAWYAVWAHDGHWPFWLFDLLNLQRGLLAITLFFGVWQLGLCLGATERHRLLWLCAGSVPLAGCGVRSLVSYKLLPSTEEIVFVCGVLVVLLWLWKLCYVPQDQTAVRLLNVLSVYFLLLFIVYAAATLAPHRTPLSVYNLSCEAEAWLPIGSAFALLLPNDISSRLP